MRKGPSHLAAIRTAGPRRRYLTAGASPYQPLSRFGHCSAQRMGLSCGQPVIITQLCRYHVSDNNVALGNFLLFAINCDREAPFFQCLRRGQEGQFFGVRIVPRQPIELLNPAESREHILLRNGER